MTLAHTHRIAATLVLAALVLGPLDARGQCTPPARNSGSPYGLIGADTIGAGGKGRGANFSWARVFVHWKDIEPNASGEAANPGAWAGTRAYLADLYAQGYSIMIVFNQIPPWAYNGVPAGIDCSAGPHQGTLNRPPASAAYFQSFAYQAALNLGDLVAAWEPWNEPDVCWHFRGTKQQWRDLIHDPGFDGIRAARPGALVGGPALGSAGSMNEFTNWLEEGGYLTRPLSFISTHGFGYEADVKTQMDRAAEYLNAPNRGYYRNPSTGVVTFPLTRGYWITAFGFYTGGSGDICGGHNEPEPGEAYKAVMNKCWNSAWCYKTFYFILGDAWYFSTYPNCDVPLLKHDYTPKTRYYTIRDYIAAHNWSMY
jgi:hypothetical protein